MRKPEKIKNATGVVFLLLAMVVTVFMLLDLEADFRNHGPLAGLIISGDAFYLLGAFGFIVLLLPAYYAWRRLIRLNPKEVEESEALSDRGEGLLNIGYTSVNVAEILAWCVFFILVTFPIPPMRIALGYRILTFGAIAFVKRKLNVQNKKLHPQRKGNPELTEDFERQWLASWDEAERRIAYIAAFRTQQLLLKYIYIFALLILLVLRGPLIRQFNYDLGVLPYLLVAFFAVFSILSNAVISNRMQRGNRIE